MNVNVNATLDVDLDCVRSEPAAFWSGHVFGLRDRQNAAIRVDDQGSVHVDVHVHVKVNVKVNVLVRFVGVDFLDGREDVLDVNDAQPIVPRHANAGFLAKQHVRAVRHT